MEDNQRIAYVHSSEYVNLANPLKLHIRSSVWIARLGPKLRETRYRRNWTEASLYRRVLCYNNLPRPGVRSRAIPAAFRATGEKPWDGRESPFHAIKSAELSLSARLMDD